METIKPGKYVELAYTVYEIDGNERIEMMKFTPQQPDSFVFGVEQGMIEAFEAKLQGLKVGDKFAMRFKPEEAFGSRSDEYILSIDKGTFMVDGTFDDKQIAPGKTLPMMTQDGYRVQGIVLEVTDSHVKMDFNHPLADSTLEYEGEVLEVRDATQEELTPSQHSCGCGCGHDDKESGGGCNGCEGCN